jgi:hypothetical protein
MIRDDVFDLIEAVLRDCGNADEPFGGKTLILSGDFFQIAPVTLRTEVEKKHWAFNSTS